MRPEPRLRLLPDERRAGRSAGRRVVPPARRRLPRGARGAEPRRAARAHRRHARRPHPARHADDLRGRRGAGRARRRCSPATSTPTRSWSTRIGFDEGITGWAARRREAALVNQAHLDPRVSFVPGTPIDPEALISIPLVARAQIKGVLNIYRVGEDGVFTEDEFELAKRFADAAALALDNAQIRARLEHQAQTDSLTGLFNHRAFHERLLHALQEASRTHRPVAVLMLDIDDFKRVNDVHGHGVGDEVLQQLAETLRVVRPAARTSSAASAARSSA